MRQVFFTDANTGYACGGSATTADSLGEFLKTTDGGSTWKVFYNGFKVAVFGFCMPEPDILYVVGKANSIFKSIDSGKTFVKQVSPITTANYMFNSVAFVNKDVGYAAGISGRMIKTIDGGATWEEITTNFNSLTINKIALPDDFSTVIICGLKAQLSKSTDGGATWTSLTPGITTMINTVRFKDTNIGYLGGNSLGMAKTTDGGATWKPMSLSQSLASNTNILSVGFTDKYVFAGTSNGEILSSALTDTIWKVAGRLTTTAIYEIGTFGSTVWAVGAGGVIIKGTEQEDTFAGNNNTNPAGSFELAQNYPNPFNPSTTIRYSIPSDGKVSLKVYNLLGREVVTLVNQNKVRGSYSVQFNAVNMSSGIYFYQLQVNGSIINKKMTFMK
ncbi:MAG: YCF48-related protein [Ignavibacteria bacterium]